MATPTYFQLVDPTQAGPGFTAESYPQRLLTIAAMIASGQNPDGTQNPSSNPQPGFGTPVAAANTLPAGSLATATVTSSGPTTAIIFTFTFGIPQGAQGTPGATGATGPQGPPGTPAPTSNPTGFIASNTGPPSTTNFTALSDATSVGFTSTAGRTYMAIAQAPGQQITAAAQSLFRIRDPTGGDWFGFPNNITNGVGQLINTNIVGWFQPTTSGPLTCHLMANSPAGALQVNANSCSLAIFDMGT